MQNIFFLKTANAKSNAGNSIILRFKLAATTKYKVKGLGISCSKKDWNQEDQRVRRSHSDHVRLNEKLEFIAKELKEIEEVREVKAEEIDTIVEASRKGWSLKELDENSQLLTTMISSLYDYIKDSPNHSFHYKRIFPSVLKTLNEFEKKVKYQITGTRLNKSTLPIQDDLVKFFRAKGRKDSSIKKFLTILNSAILHFNKYSGKEISTFSKNHTKWSKDKRQIVFLNSVELKALYDSVFNPATYPELKPTRIELKKIKYFLFRCFSGMRVGDMNKSNINPTKLKKEDVTFTYYQHKVDKKSTVSCIQTKLYDIATSLNWEFPDFSTESKLTSYGHLEGLVIKKYLRVLLKGNMRQIEHKTGKSIHYTDLADEISTHTARKSFAHLLYNISKDVMLVKKQLGHSTIETTMKYLDFDISGDSMDLKNVNLGF